MISIVPAAATITRPADTTAYASGDQVNNSTTATSVTPFSFTVPSDNLKREMLATGVRLVKSTSSVTNASFRVHLYSAAPTVATTGDNAAFTNVTGASVHLGAFDITDMHAHADGAVGYGEAVSGNFRGVGLKGGTTIYGMIEARAAYTPGSEETFTLQLEAIDNE